MLITLGWQEDAIDTLQMEKIWKIWKNVYIYTHTHTYIYIYIIYIIYIYIYISVCVCVADCQKFQFLKSDGWSWLIV